MMRIKLLACAFTMFPLGPGVAGAADPVPESLAPPAGLKRLLELNAEGVQIYRCGPPKDGTAAPAPVWNFEAPRATLTDHQGQPAGRHYAGPTWEAPDGSKITGKVAAKAAAPDPHAIAWLLLKTESAGAAGRFDPVRAVQRVSTSGGSAPAGECGHVGEVLEVPYRAVYVFWVQ
jgi:hypothetical protein